MGVKCLGKILGCHAHFGHTSALVGVAKRNLAIASTLALEL